MVEFIRRRPVKAFLLVVLPAAHLIFWTLLVGGQKDLTPGLLLILVIMLATSLLMTRAIGGKAATRRLRAGWTRWRLGWAAYLFLGLAMPAATLLVALVAGTARHPQGGAGKEAINYLLGTVVVGLLVANLWEETAWGGFVQARLMQRHGLLVGSLLTALPFFVFHIPVGFGDKGLHTALGPIVVNWLLIAVLAPVLRYAIGSLLVDTGGSLLAAGLFHASFNGAGSLASISPDGWENIPGLVLVTVALVAFRKARGRSLTEGETPSLLPSP